MHGQAWRRPVWVRKAIEIEEEASSAGATDGEAESATITPPRIIEHGKALLRRFRSEHGPALGLYAILSVALTWPLIHVFRSQILGPGSGDAQVGVWILWMFEQWTHGAQPLFSTHLLYYPRGITLLTAGIGPLSGIFSLPFWTWGPTVAYNGTVLVGLCLTGYCMYLLARGLGFDWGVALFAGIALEMSPLHLAGLEGHLDKVFIGLQPLALLAAHYALDLKRRWWWTIATAFVLFLLFFHNGYQFIFGALAVGFFMLASLITAERAERLRIVRRCVLIGASAAIFVGPGLIAALKAEGDPSLSQNVHVNVTSGYYSPDAVEFVLPSFYQESFGLVTRLVGRLVATPYPKGWIGLYSIESAVSIPIVMLLLCFVAWRRGGRLARIWTLFSLCAVILSLGPTLRVFGQTTFTNLDEPIVLPYAFLVSLPGMQFMRTPARFMEIAAVGVAVTACFGLTWLTRRWPHQRVALVGIAVLLLLVEAWPAPWPHAALPVVPEFYKQLARDPDQYGVLDLPGGADDLDAVYQTYQITHHKAIAWGYLAHSYAVHPLSTIRDFKRFGTRAPDILLNGEPSDLYANAQDDLARAGYRYVVWHKTLFRQLRNATETDSETLIRLIFGARATPLIDNDKIAVYRVSPAARDADLAPTLALGAMWQPMASGVRWTPSPGTLEITSPIQQQALLHVTLASMFDPAAPNGFGMSGTLAIQNGDQVQIVQATAGVPFTVPLSLNPGKQTVALSFLAGNFQPSKYGGVDPTQLSFAIRTVDLQTANVAAMTVTEPPSALPADILINGQMQQSPRTQVVATYGKDWYEYEPSINGRWAASPAEIFIYSATKRTVRCSMTPLLFVSDGKGGLSKSGTLLIKTQEGEQRASLRIDQPLTAKIPLHEGWNRVTLALQAGNFRPVDAKISADPRLLGFAVSNINVLMS